MSAPAPRAPRGARAARADAGGGLELRVDWTACDGRGLCAELLPELLTTDPWGYPVVRDGGRRVAVPASLEGAAREAERSCPVLALRLAARGTASVAVATRPTVPASRGGSPP